MGDLPTGTVTFVFTDIEGSTDLWDRAPEAMEPALARHDELVRGAIERHAGSVFATGGDGFAAAFSSVGDGVRAAEAIQAGIGAEPWGVATIRVRVGVHVGEVDERDGDFFGPAVNRAARIMSSVPASSRSCGHGAGAAASPARCRRSSDARRSSTR